MPIEINWTNSANASAIYAAVRLTYLRSGGATNPILRTMVAAAERLDALIDRSCEDAGRAWEELLYAASGCSDTDQFHKRVKDSPISGNAEAFADCVLECISEFNACCPNFASEIQYRELPLRNLWGAEGPGLLNAIDRLAGRPQNSRLCTLSLVQPVGSGGGFAVSSGDDPTVMLEAVMTNENLMLPETLRLAWLVATACIDRTQLVSSIGKRAITSNEVLPLAMIPVTLAAGEELGITRLADETIKAAVSSWASSPTSSAELVAESVLANIVGSWWAESQEAVGSTGIAASIAALANRVAESA